MKTTLAQHRRRKCKQSGSGIQTVPTSPRKSLKLHSVDSEVSKKLRISVHRPSSEAASNFFSPTTEPKPVQLCQKQESYTDSIIRQSIRGFIEPSRNLLLDSTTEEGEIKESDGILLRTRQSRNVGTTRENSRSNGAATKSNRSSINCQEQMRATAMNIVASTNSAVSSVITILAGKTNLLGLDLSKVKANQRSNNRTTSERFPEKQKELASELDDLVTIEVIRNRSIDQQNTNQSIEISNEPKFKLDKQISLLLSRKKKVKRSQTVNTSPVALLKQILTPTAVNSQANSPSEQKKYGSQLSQSLSLKPRGALGFEIKSFQNLRHKAQQMKERVQAKRDQLLQLPEKTQGDMKVGAIRNRKGSHHLLEKVMTKAVNNKFSNPTEEKHPLTSYTETERTARQPEAISEEKNETTLFTEVYSVMPSEQPKMPKERSVNRNWQRKTVADKPRARELRKAFSSMLNGSQEIRRMHCKATTMREDNGKATYWRKSTKLAFDGQLDLIKKKLKVENTMNHYMDFESHKKDIYRRTQMLDRIKHQAQMVEENLKITEYHRAKAFKKLTFYNDRYAKLLQSQIVLIQRWWRGLKVRQFFKSVVRKDISRWRSKHHIAVGEMLQLVKDANDRMKK